MFLWFNEPDQLGIFEFRSINARYGMSDTIGPDHPVIWSFVSKHLHSLSCKLFSSFSENLFFDSTYVAKWPRVATLCMYRDPKQKRLSPVIGSAFAKAVYAETPLLVFNNSRLHLFAEHYWSGIQTLFCYWAFSLSRILVQMWKCDETFLVASAFGKVTLPASQLPVTPQI